MSERTMAVSVPVSTTAKVGEVRAIKWGILGRGRSVPHLERKLYHMAMGLGCFFLYAFVLERNDALVVLALFGGAFVILDLVRLWSSSLNVLALRVFGRLMRREELRQPSANSFYVLGLFLILILFPKPIVLMSILFLAVGDPIAAIIGIRFGRHRLFGKKSVEGSCANGLSCAFSVWILSLFYFQQPIAASLGLALTGGVVSMVAELIPSPVDDNLTIPVFSALLLSVISPWLPVL